MLKGFSPSGQGTLDLKENGIRKPKNLAALEFPPGGSPPIKILRFFLEL
jgi:hypothetical protein